MRFRLERHVEEPTCGNVHALEDVFVDRWLPLAGGHSFDALVLEVDVGDLILAEEDSLVFGDGDDHRFLFHRRIRRFGPGQLDGQARTEQRRRDHEHDEQHEHHVD